MSEARVSVIIPAWNLWPVTAACLRSLAEHSGGENVETVVVDNGSTDATVTELEPLGRALFGRDFCPVRLPENLGFARGCNAGARAAGGDLLFFLNNDTTLSPGWLPPLRRAMEGAGAAGPLLLYPDGTVQHCGIFLTPFRRVGHLYENFPGAHAVTRRKRPLQAVTGAALMLRRDVFTDCGGFCEEYVNGFEDMDLCCLLRRKGLKLAVAGESVVTHHTSQTPGRFDRDAENGALFARRHGRALRPDLHIHAALDGYRLRLGPLLGCWLALPEEKERELNAATDAAPFSEDRCRRLLEREPLWLGGHVRLMDHFLERGQARLAVAQGLRAAGFFPLSGEGAALRHRLLAAARQVGDPELAAQAGLLKSDHLTDDAAQARALAREARRRAAADGDAPLTALLDQWLAAQRRPPGGRR